MEKLVLLFFVSCLFSFNMAHCFPEVTGDIDVVTDAEVGVQSSALSSQMFGSFARNSQFTMLLMKLELSR